MITGLTQPSAFMSAYEPNVYSFYLRVNAGSFNLSTYASLQAFDILISPDGLFKKGQYVYCTIASIVCSGIVTRERTLTDPARVKLITGNVISALYSNIALTIGLVEPATMVLKAGRAAIGDPLIEVARFRGVAKNALYKLDVQGYLQDLFYNVDKPNFPIDLTLGTEDSALYTQYCLFVDYNGYEWQVGTSKTSIYSTIQGLNATTYVSDGDALLEANAISQGTKKYMWSFISFNQVRTRLR